MQFTTTTLPLLILTLTTSKTLAAPLNKGNTVYGLAKDDPRYNADGSVNYIPGGQGWSGTTRIYVKGFGQPE